MRIRLQEIEIETSGSPAGAPPALAPGWRAETIAPRDHAQARTLLGLHPDQVRLLRQALAADDRGAVWRLSDRDVLDGAAARLVSRRWRAWRIVPPAPPVGTRRAPPPPAPEDPFDAMWRAATPQRPPAPTPAALHWIEIELVGEDGKPIPGEAYRVMLPDGTQAAGLLDANGFARLDRLPAGGTCQVCFPDLDGEAWQWLETTAARG